MPVPAELADLWIGSLEPLPADPGNRWADDARAAELGEQLFFDKRLSSNGQVSCATCHEPGVFVNIGKAIAAYERRIGYGASRFDRYVASWAADGVPPRGVLTPDEVAGMNLFVGKANCIQCHNGPLFTNNEFHNTGVPQRPGLPADRGRIVAAGSVKSDEFSCRSRWSDAKPGESWPTTTRPRRRLRDIRS